MSSYTKQLMEMAAPWIAANPDPNDPFLKVPHLERIRDEYERDQASTEATFRRAVRMSNHPSKLAQVEPAIEELIGINSKVMTLHDEIEETMRDLENEVNTVPEGAAKTRDAAALNGRFLLAWARDGFNVFELSADFVAAMLLTDSREIDIARARPPFRGIVMLLPDGFAKDGGGRSYTRVHVSEVTGREAMMLGAAQDVDRELGKLPPEESRRVLEQVTREHNQSTGPAWIGNSPTKLTAEPPVDRIYIHASNGTWGMYLCAKRDGLTWSKIEAELAEIEDDGDARAMRTIQMIVFSTLAYISAISGSVESIQASGKRRAPAAGDGPKRWSIGRTIKLEPTLVRAVRDGAREVAFRLKHRHIVRGHFRNQPYGPGRAERKEIWIAPFWKGPEEGAALVHTYKLPGARDDG